MAACATQQAHVSADFQDEMMAFAMQLKEIELAKDEDKGKYRVDHPPDFAFALRSFQGEMERYKTYLDDHKLAQSIGTAIHSDGGIIAALASEDVQAHEDRCLAMRLSADAQLDGLPSTLRPTSDSQRLDEWLALVARTTVSNSLAGLSDDGCDEDVVTEHSIAGPSMTSKERQAMMLDKLASEFTCVCCHERRKHASMVKLQCNDRYCLDCLKNLFARAIRDEQLFPPRCCKVPIPTEPVLRHMTVDQVKAYENAADEFTTTDRVYCSNHNCGKFISLAQRTVGTNVGRCVNCGTQTCTLCKNAYHKGSDCPDDPAMHETRQLALTMGWQTCFSCNTLVQLRSGCNHMTCRCKAEFCYVCGVKWKKCRCKVADENRIIERAEEVVDRDAQEVLLPAERARRVNQVHAVLRDQHECDHSGRFRRVDGDGWSSMQCELCDAQHWKYILQCRRCFLNACEDCRRNRI